MAISTNVRSEWVDLILGMGRMSFPFQAVAEVTGISVDVLQNAAKRGELRRVYPSSKPVVLTPDLIMWLESLPETPPRR
jgi:hypothetical protein